VLFLVNLLDVLVHRGVFEGEAAEFAPVVSGAGVKVLLILDRPVNAEHFAPIIDQILTPWFC